MVTCLHAAPAKDPSPFRFGVAHFAKVSLWNQVVPSRVNTHVPSVLTDLFICDLCDSKGIPDLTFLSGKHTEEHHLIRCLAPEEAKEVLFSTEKRLTSLETRLGYHANIHDLGGRIGNIQQLLRPAGSIG